MLPYCPFNSTEYFWEPLKISMINFSVTNIIPVYPGSAASEGLKSSVLCCCFLTLFSSVSKYGSVEFWKSAVQQLSHGFFFNRDEKSAQ